MMKPLFIVLAILLLAASAMAQDWSVEVRPTTIIYKDSEIKGGTGAEVRAGMDNIYLYGSHNPLQIYGAWMDIKGVGIGGKFKLAEGFNAWLQVGYYDPSSRSDWPWEGIYFRQCQYLAPTYAPASFDNYRVDFSPNYGAEAGLDFTKQIYGGLSLGISAGYRILKLDEMNYGWDNGGSPGITGWQMGEQRDFGGYIVSGIIKYEL